MLIKFSDFIQAREQVEKRVNELTQMLRNEAEEFLTQYKQSLFTPNDTWSDGKRDYPYARLMNLTDKEMFVQQSTQSLVLDKQNNVSFFIATLINENTQGGQWIYVPIRMSINNRNVMVTIDNSGHEEVPLGGEGRGYHDACGLVKEAVIKQIKSRFPN
ncbi:hypothetical protein [Kosakonia cowanii]|jgi:hypothetical protein|uniref:hypothetical protein n=1 Tax=Kosakonia cowanii TaxID=208223 RepID=UPI0030765323